MKHLKTVLASIIPTLLITACNSPIIGEIDNTGTTFETHSFVCDPFGRSLGYEGKTNGLAASLFYAPSNSKKPTNARDYITYGTKVDSRIFFNQLNIPTRLYDRPFSTTSSKILLNDVGQPIYEYFGIKAESTIQLTNLDSPGLYQFAILSDDGAILEVKPNSSEITGVATSGIKTIIDDSEIHQTKFSCAQEAIKLDYNSRLPMNLTYFQGPRYHIALMLLWRQIPDISEDSFFDSQCGEQGNEMYFNPRVSPSAPTETYERMQERGWRVLRPGNFLIPENPCAILPIIGSQS